MIRFYSDGVPVGGISDCNKSARKNREHRMWRNAGLWRDVVGFTPQISTAAARPPQTHTVLLIAALRVGQGERSGTVYSGQLRVFPWGERMPVRKARGAQVRPRRT